MLYRSVNKAQQTRVVQDRISVNIVPMATLKNTLFSLGLAAASGYSLWKGMPWPSIVALILLSGLLYRQYTRALINSCLAFIDSARIAKFGQFEIQSDRSLVDPSKTDLRELMLKNLKPDELGLLFALYPDKRHPLSNQKARDSVVALRNRGWLAHDKAYLGDSDEIWLTPQARIVLASVVPENLSFDRLPDANAANCD